MWPRLYTQLYGTTAYDDSEVDVASTTGLMRLACVYLRWRHANTKRKAHDGVSNYNVDHACLSEPRWINSDACFVSFSDRTCGKSYGTVHVRSIRMSSCNRMPHPCLSVFKPPTLNGEHEKCVSAPGNIDVGLWYGEVAVD